MSMKCFHSLFYFDDKIISVWEIIWIRRWVAARSSNCCRNTKYNVWQPWCCSCHNCDWHHLSSSVCDIQILPLLKIWLSQARKQDVFNQCWQLYPWWSFTFSAVTYNLSRSWIIRCSHKMPSVFLQVAQLIFGKKILRQRENKKKWIKDLLVSKWTICFSVQSRCHCGDSASSYCHFNVVTRTWNVREWVSNKDKGGETWKTSKWFQYTRGPQNSTLHL